jgi:uncharacterized protein RhaS with RHS repeats
MKRTFHFLLVICALMVTAHVAHAFYDPTVGRFLSMDPIDNNKGESPYTYVGGDPVNKIDPDGRQEFFIMAEEPFVLRPVLETARPIETVRPVEAPQPVETPKPVDAPKPVDDPIQAHHSDPKFMGGDPDQPLTDMSRSSHQDLHNTMNKFLEQYTDEAGNNMRPTSNNSGQDIKTNFPRAERLDALKDFYNGPGAQWPNAAQDFFTQHPELLPTVVPPGYYILKKKPCLN